MVDLGDTSGKFTPFMLAPPEQPGKDKLHIPLAKNSQDAKVVDLQSLGFTKKGEIFSIFRERRVFDWLEKLQEMKSTSNRLSEMWALESQEPNVMFSDNLCFIGGCQTAEPG